VVKDLKLENHIEFTGALYGNEKQLKLENFDFYVHPAYSDVVSIAVMEAMANGLPCVITRTSQVSYYYASNSFIMIEPLVQDIKRGLIEMIDKKEFWHEMSVNSISLINSIFNWENATGLMLNEYRNILISKSHEKC
jgi:glycosyltransferase involved in cell wall biosynthesis